MRIYNAKRAQIEMPLSNGTKLVIPGHSVSGEFMPNSTIISVFMTSYSTKEVAFIISGPYEIAMLSNFAGSGDYVVSSLEEAVARFAPKADPTTTTTTTTMAPVVDEPIVEKNESEILPETSEEDNEEASVHPVEEISSESTTPKEKKKVVIKKKTTISGEENSKGE